jgi:radical SAM superfamily enzyme YgiQ (UPF0313 family)
MSERNIRPAGKSFDNGHNPVYLFLNLPNPPGRNIYRGYGGGFGVAGPAAKETLLPIYLLYGASAARNVNAQYRVVDAQAMGYPPQKVRELVKDIRPDVLVSLVSLPSLRDDLKILGEVKRDNPRTLVILLGPAAGAMPEKALSISGADAVMKGDYPYYSLVANLIQVFQKNPAARESFHKIEGAVYLEDGKLVQTAAPAYRENLEDVSFDVYAELPIERYLLDIPDIKWKNAPCFPILTSTGCPFGCMYCPYPIGYGPRVATKSVGRIADEMEYLGARFGVRGFLFLDQDFVFDENRATEICDEILHRGLKVRWLVEARVDRVSEPILAKMKEAGCFRVHYGVETGSDDMLEIGKPGVKIETVKNAFKMTRKLGMATTAHIILGLPGENQESLKSTFKLLCELDPDNANLNVATPYPGTKLFEEAEAAGRIATRDWAQYTGYTAIMPTGSLDVAEVAAAARDMTLRFRLFKFRHDPGCRLDYLRSLAARVKNYRMLSRK